MLRTQVQYTQVLNIIALFKRVKVDTLLFSFQHLSDELAYNKGTSLVGDFSSITIQNGWYYALHRRFESRPFFLFYISFPSWSLPSLNMSIQ